MILIPGGICNIVNADTQLHKNDALGNQLLVGQGLATAPCPGGKSLQCRPSPGAGRSRNVRPGRAGRLRPHRRSTNLAAAPDIGVHYGQTRRNEI
jgi:hypothetical protein